MGAGGGNEGAAFDSEVQLLLVREGAADLVLLGIAHPGVGAQAVADRRDLAVLCDALDEDVVDLLGVEELHELGHPQRLLGKV